MAALDAAFEAMLFQPDYGCAGRSRPAIMLAQLGASALDFLYPPHCVSCRIPLPGRIASAVCVDCARRISWIGADRCMRCGDAVGMGSGAVPECVSCRQHPPRFVSATCCVARYEEGPLQDLVLGLKFGAKAFEAKMLGCLMAARIRQTGLLEGERAPILIPAPLTRGGLFKRGYNQAAELALWIGRELKLTVETGLLKKIKTTLPQATLSAQRRRTNVEGAFACAPRALKNYPDADVLLIDDVITTGSTISECARVLHQAGFKRIVAASIARG